jgi:hypothetical protein
MPVQQAATILEPLENRQLLSNTWYATGGLAANGNGSAGNPWNSLAAINTAINNSTIVGGDTVELAGTFNQSGQELNVSAGITVTSNGSSPALIAEPSGWNLADALHVTTGNVALSNLTLTGPGIGVSSANQYGIYCSDTSGSSNYSNVTISNCNVSGFVMAGIMFQGHSHYGFDNVTMSNCNSSNNQVSGIVFADAVGPGNQSTPKYDFQNVTIIGCTTDGNTGRQTSGGAGYAIDGGIFLGSVNGSTVSYCVANHNCYDQNGGAGIWAFASNSLDFEFDQSCGNLTAGTLDGDGYDFDWATTDSIMQYDYAGANDSDG